MFAFVEIIGYTGNALGMRVQFLALYDPDDYWLRELGITENIDRRVGPMIREVKPRYTQILNKTGTEVYEVPYRGKMITLSILNHHPVVIPSDTIKNLDKLHGMRKVKYNE